jgi:hypothetical protein
MTIKQGVEKKVEVIEIEKYINAYSMLEDVRGVLPNKPNCAYIWRPVPVRGCVIK